MTAVLGSGTRSMSDSWISWKPRIEEPSNPEPSAKPSSVSSCAGSEKCCIKPGRSQKRKSTIWTPSALDEVQDLCRRALGKCHLTSREST